MVAQRSCPLSLRERAGVRENARARNLPISLTLTLSRRERGPEERRSALGILARMEAKSQTFPRSHRLSGKPRFDAVYQAKVRETRGPLAMYSLPNELGYCRLWMSVSRAVGIAVKRNRIKRLLREAFRLMQHDVPGGYDLVVVVRPHKTMIFAEYQKLLQGLAVRSHQNWNRRNENIVPSPGAPAGDERGRIGEG
jgi:ribonuclease P protein component